MGAMFIYRNLNVGGWQYGPKPKQPLKNAAGKAVRHDRVVAADVSFRESAASWARCLRQVNDKSCKSGWEVHAYAVGRVIADLPARAEGRFVEITYDKYGSGRFVRKDTGRALAFCEFVEFGADGHCRAFGRIVEA